MKTKTKTKTKTRKTDWKILKRLAEISPKSYAPIIRRRNKGLLKELEKGYEKVKRLYNEHDNIYYFDFNSNIGCPHCPHCRNCSECLWTKSQSKYKREACYNVNFGGNTLESLEQFEYIILDYNYSDESIEVNYPNVKNMSPAKARNAKRKFEQEYKDCKAYIQKHIDWTNKYEWGSKYKK